MPLNSRNSVELVRHAGEVVDDVGLVGQLLVHHHGEDAHLRGAPVVELDRALGGLGLLGHAVPCRLEDVAAGRAVPGEGALHLLHHEQLVAADRQDDLEGAQGGDLRERGESVGHVREREVLLEGEHARQAGVLLYHVPHDGEHSNASVLDLHVPEAVEPLLVRVRHESERVPEPDRGLRADLGLEAHLHGRGRLGGGRQGGTVEGAD